jgi:hypothetical protein
MHSLATLLPFTCCEGSSRDGVSAWTWPASDAHKVHSTRVRPCQAARECGGCTMSGGLWLASSDVKLAGKRCSVLTQGTSLSHSTVLGTWRNADFVYLYFQELPYGTFTSQMIFLVVTECFWKQYPNLVAFLACEFSSDVSRLELARLLHSDRDVTWRKTPRIPFFHF